MMHRAISARPNNPVERTGGSHSLAAAAHRERWAGRGGTHMLESI
jgi:hypothetical protein